MRFLAIFVSALAMTVVCTADTLKLKQGGSIEGMVVSSNSQEVVFMGADGVNKTYPLSAVAGIDYAPFKPKAAASGGTVVTIPAGTQIAVRTIDAVDGKTAKAGSKYRASIDDSVNRKPCRDS